MRHRLSAFLSIGAIFFASIANAADITWQAPNLDTVAADLIGGPIVTFTPLEHPTNTAAGTFFTGGGGTTGNIELNQVYDSHGWSGGGDTFSLLGLTDGTDYQLQLLAAGDTRACCATRTQAGSDGVNISGDFPRGNSSVIGTFTALGNTQDFMIIPGTEDPVDPGLSGYILTDGTGALIEAINFTNDGASPIVDTGAVVVVPPDPLPPFPLAPGNWNVRVLGIDFPVDGIGDGDIDDGVEMRAILDYAGPYNGNFVSNFPAGDPSAVGGPTPNEALNLNGWGIYEDNQESRNVVDMATGGTFDSNHPYPGPDPPNIDSEDFIVAATTEEPLNFAPGTYAINFGSDDGGYLTVKPTDGSTFAFDNEVNTDGDLGIDDTVTWNAPRGHAQTCGEFTVGPEGLSAHIESAMFERAGGDNYEISIATGECNPFGNGYFELLSDNSLANDAGTGFLVTTGTPVPNEGGELPCDLDGDGDCDQGDINLLFDADPSATEIADWLSQASDPTNSALGNPTDVLVVGDADLNGQVNSVDLGLLLNNFNTNTNSWIGGDLNDSGAVDSVDLGLLLNNFGFTSPAAAAAVPEPNAIALLGLGLLGLLARRRRN